MDKEDHEENLEDLENDIGSLVEGSIVENVY